MPRVTVKNGGETSAYSLEAPQSGFVYSEHTYSFTEGFSSCCRKFRNLTYNLSYPVRCCAQSMQETAQSVCSTIRDFFTSIGDSIATGARWVKSKIVEKVTRCIITTPYTYENRENYRMQVPLQLLAQRADIAMGKIFEDTQLYCWRKEIRNDLHDELSGVIFTPNQSKDSKWIVYFLPEDKVWEECIPKLHNYAKNTGCNVATYNYRGFGKSEGVTKNEDDLLADARNIIFQTSQQRENVFVVGEGAVGGFLATSVAAHYRLNCATVHSISSLGDYWRAKIPASGAVIGGLFSVFGWDLAAKDSINSLQKTIIVTDPDAVRHAAQFRTAYDLNDATDIDDKEKVTDIVVNDSATNYDDEMARYYAKIRELHNPPPVSM